MDRFDSLRAFVRVAECHSFSEAARRLGQSKSAISRQIADLENRLGARLFNRTTRSLTLTEAGQGYVERCQHILSDLEEADRAVSNLQAEPRGTLRINAPMSFGVLHLSPLIPLFLERYPQVDIDMAMNDRIVNLVEEGFDLAIRIAKLVDSSLIARRLAPARRVVSASPAYLTKYGIPRTPGDLTRHCCLSYSNMTLSDEWSFVTAEGHRWPVEVHGRLRVNNPDTLREAALAGAGLVMLPSFMVGRDLQAGTLVPVLSEFLVQDIAIYAVYPANRHLSPKVRTFVEFLLAHWGPRPYWDLVD